MDQPKLPRKQNKRPRRRNIVPLVVEADSAVSPIQKANNSKDALSFARALKEGVARLKDEECRLLLKTVQGGKPLRLMAKKAALLWGDEFDGGTAEVAGPTVYRELLKKLDHSDAVHNPQSSLEMMAEYGGYQIWYETPACVYSIRGPGVLEVFAPRYLPIAGMDVEDAAHALDIIQRLPQPSEAGEWS